jgi:hypothetical protein
MISSSSDSFDSFDSSSSFSLYSSSSSSFIVFNDSHSLYDSKLLWNTLKSHFKQIAEWEKLLFDWDQKFEIRLNEIIEANDKNQKLCLQRELIYKRSIQSNDWAFTFFSEIAKDSDSSDILRRHISKNATNLQAENLKEWECSHVNSASSSSTNLSSFMFKSFSIKRVLKSLSLKERLERVVENVQNDEKSARIASKVYEISRTIIRNRIKNNKSLKSHSIKKRILLIENEEKFLLNFIENYFKLEFSAKFWMLREKISNLIRLRNDEENPHVDEHWARRFLKRHSQYKSRFSRHLDQDRYFNSNIEIFVKWFELFEKTMTKNKIIKKRIFNMNEKSYLTEVAKKVLKIIILSSFKIVFSVQSECRKWTTIINAMFYTSSLDSMIIFSKKQVQKKWITNFLETIFEVNVNDWTNNQHELIWLKKCFDVQIKHLNEKRLLLMNDHTSHVSIDFIEYCWWVVYFFQLIVYFFSAWFYLAFSVIFVAIKIF